MSMTVFSVSSKKSHENRIQILASIIVRYKWIIDAYVSDFYAKGFWDRLPSSLQHYFDSICAPDLAWLLYPFNEHETNSSRPRHTKVPPLSLLALRNCIDLFALQRSAINVESELTRNAILTALETKLGKENKSKSNNGESDESKSVYIGKPPAYKNGQCMDMQHVFRKHVKPKKQHEINNLGQIIKLLSEASECQSVVDVGAGLGHLARLLTFQHGLQVTTVEAAGGHAPKASELDRDLRKNIHKAKRKQAQAKQQLRAFCTSGTNKNTNAHSHGSLECLQTIESELCECSTAQRLENNALTSSLMSNLTYSNPSCNTNKDSKTQTSLEEVEDEKKELPCHVICTIQPDIAAEQFIEILMRNSNKEEGVEETGNMDFVLAGLHACGDLTPTLMRVFLNCPFAKGLACVACCYMKMSATRSSGSVALNNFPMSTHLRGVDFEELSYEAREMACHFADSYRQRLKDNPSHLKIHSYRAALQLLVTTVDPTFKSGQARLVSKNGTNGTFAQYAEDNLKKLNLDVDAMPQHLLEHCERLTHQWMRVVAFYTLRLCMASLVESLILCDRALFLLEQGIPSVLVPIFDSNISPRNFVLLASKR